MSKDKSGAELKVGDRITITGVVAHVGESDGAPCQVHLDSQDGDNPLVTMESRLLQAAAPIKAEQKKAESQPKTEQQPPVKE